MSKLGADKEATVREAFGRLKSIRAVQRETGISRQAIRRVLEYDAPEDNGGIPWPIPAEESRARRLFSAVQPDNRRVTIITSAQNNTAIHEALWANLLALADHLDARIIVGGFIYRKDAQGQRGQEKKHDDKAERAVEWDSRITPYLVDVQQEIAPDLVWCGEMNILPTAERPLSGLDNYTGTKSAIFPHPKIALESVATSKREPAKFNYTTGAITVENYIQRKAGLKAQFHHVYGALIVEVDDTGDWFVRQLNASGDGTIQDLDTLVRDGRVTVGHSVEAVNWGDIHVHHLEDWMREACWGEGGIIDQLRPRFQFFHDTLDFNSRSHHDVKDPHQMFERFVEGSDSVEYELRRVVDFLQYAHRQFCQSVVVESNHDNAFVRWLKEGDYKGDYVNAIFFLKSQLRYYEALRDREQRFHLFEWALRELGLTISARFLDEDDSFVICPDMGGGIECAMHGHLGLNGARGNPRQFVKMGRRLNIGHGHGAQIVDGVYMAGVMGALDQGYNKGPSNWSHSLIVTYSHGKRAMVTMRNKKWRGRT